MAETVDLTLVLERLNDLMTGLSIVALGTSLPDTFASSYASLFSNPPCSGSRACWAVLWA